MMPDQPPEKQSKLKILLPVLALLLGGGGLPGYYSLWKDFHKEDISKSLFEKNMVCLNEPQDYSERTGNNDFIGVKICNSSDMLIEVRDHNSDPLHMDWYTYSNEGSKITLRPIFNSRLYAQESSAKPTTVTDPKTSGIASHSGKDLKSNDRNLGGVSTRCAKLSTSQKSTIQRVAQMADNCWIETIDMATGKITKNNAIPCSRPCD